MSRDDYISVLLDDEYVQEEKEKKEQKEFHIHSLLSDMETLVFDLAKKGIISGHDEITINQIIHSIRQREKYWGEK
jgi:hypothetical protein|tara:strand:+ start:319 stop:546 length:228 start_codon:yes stop_codon:yes gene_type:complete